jgi:hypothetical protein
MSPHAANGSMLAPARVREYTPGGGVDRRGAAQAAV